MTRIDRLSRELASTMTSLYVTDPGGNVEVKTYIDASTPFSTFFFPRALIQSAAPEAKSERFASV